MSGETIIGFRCNGFVILAACGTSSHYYIKLSDKEDKIVPVDGFKMMALTGENGSRSAFASYVTCNIALNTMRQHGRPATTPSTAAFMRDTLAKSLRGDGGYSVNSLLAGYDKPTSAHDAPGDTTHLYYLDYLGTMHPVPFGAHGYGTAFVLAMLDRHWRADLTAQEGVDLMQRCCEEVRQRVVLSHMHFVVKVVTASGIELVPGVH